MNSSVGLSRYNQPVVICKSVIISCGAFVKSLQQSRFEFSTTADCFLVCPLQKSLVLTPTDDTGRLTHCWARYYRHSQTRKRGFESSCSRSKPVQFCVASVHSQTHMDIWLQRVVAFDLSCSNCSVAEYFPEKFRLC